jgi:hypothetical protein
MNKFLFSALLILCGSSFALADNGLGVNAGAHWGLGSAANSQKTIPVRTMNTIDLQALPGYHFDNLLVGVLMELRFVGQNTDPATVSNQNLKGTGYLFGLGAMYLWNNWKFLGSLDFLGKHSLGVVDSSGKYSTFKKPRGFHLLVGYKFFERISADLSFSYETYKQNTLGTTDADISDNKLKHWNAGLGATYDFFL